MPSNAEISYATAGVSRRGFLALAWKGLLGLSGLFGIGGVLRFMSYQPETPSPSRYDLGKPEDYPPGSRTRIPEASALIVAAPEGFVAYSLVCPHLGCTVEENTQGFACPCHGSTFSMDGELTRGPASQNLTKLRLETGPDGGLVLIKDSVSD